MVRAPLPAALVVALMIGCPATAFAQNGASDNQYADPFANTAPTTTHKSQSPRPTSPASTSTAAAPASAPAAPTASTSGPPAAASATGTAPTHASGSLRTLPYTGLDAADEALAGAALLLVGAALRLRLRRSPTGASGPAGR